VFGIYVRVSEVGGREGDSFGSPAIQEAAARDWAERNDLEVEVDPVVEQDVSGATAAADRELGRLIERCEAGELEGIIVRDEDRFSRDLIDGVLTLERLDSCGARLIATLTGFDSQHLTPEKQMLYEFKLSMAKAQRSRNRAARIIGKQRAAERGLHLATRVPLGYKWVDRQKGGRGQEEGGGIGRLVPDPRTQKKVQQAFRMRADGASYSDLAKHLGVAGKSSARAIVTNRVYVGEATVPTERTGVTRTVENAHPPLVTPTEWEAANAQGGRFQPRTGKWAAMTRLNGLARCGGCGKALSVGSIRQKTPYYSCTHEHCTAKTGIRAGVLDDYVGGVLTQAVLDEVPAVVAILEGDDRYQRALDAVAEAQAELEAYRSTVKVSVVGAASFERDVAARQEAVKLARAALRDVPRTKAAYSDPLPVSAAQWAKADKAERTRIIEAAMDKDRLARFVARVVVRQCGRGKVVPPAERVAVFFHGSEAEFFMVDWRLARMERKDAA
jgi:DNA invertase Pin-like site-specific DNA recombinase